MKIRSADRADVLIGLMALELSGLMTMESVAEAVRRNAVTERSRMTRPLLEPRRSRRERPAVPRTREFP